MSAQILYQTISYELWTFTFPPWIILKKKRCGLLTLLTTQTSQLSMSTMVSQSRTPMMRKWGNRINERLRKKRNLITAVLLCGLSLLALQLFCYFVLDPAHVCCLSLLILELLQLCRLVLCLLQILDLQLFCCFFFYSVQLLLVLHLKLSKHSNKPYQTSFCAFQLALQSLFVCFRLSACCPIKLTTSRLLI